MSFLPQNKPDPVAYYESQGLEPAGGRRWTKWTSVGCAFHGGSDSMRINTESGGYVCMACGESGGDVVAYQMRLHGQTFVEAAKALGCWQDDPTDKSAPRRKPLPFAARDALEVLKGEALLCAVAGANVARGVELTEEDRRRVMEAAGRIRFIAEAAGV